MIIYIYICDLKLYTKSVLPISQRSPVKPVFEQSQKIPPAKSAWQTLPLHGLEAMAHGSITKHRNI